MLLEGSVASENAIATTFGIDPRSFREVAREICAPYAPSPVAQA